MNKEKIEKVATEAAKLLFDNPGWAYKRAIETARELIEDESMVKMEETS